MICPNCNEEIPDSKGCCEFCSCLILKPKSRSEMSDENDSEEDSVFHEDFGDPEVMLNSRDWLQNALESKGATWTGKGMGMGRADIDIELEGMEYNVTIRPRIKR